MRWVSRATVPLLFAALAWAPSTALALHVAPPGHAGASEYFETIPSSAGNVAPPSAGDASNPQRAGSIAAIGVGSAGVRHLARLGLAGRTAAAFEAATAPPRQSLSGGSVAGGSGGAAGADSQLALAEREAARTAAGGSTMAGLWSAIAGSDSGGIGLFLPLLMALSLVGAIVLAFRRSPRGR
jgi:hypothetical protein